MNEFLAKLEAYLRELVAEAVAFGPLPNTIWYHFEKSANGFSVGPVFKINWWSAHARVTLPGAQAQLDRVRESIEADKQIDSFFRDTPHIFINGQPASGPLDHRLSSVVRRFLYYLTEANAPDFSEGSFELLRGELTAEIQRGADRAPAATTSFLQNSPLESDVEIAQGIRLRNTTAEEIERLCNSFDTLDFPEPGYWASVLSLLEVEHEANAKSFLFHFDEPFKQVDTLRGLLRLERPDVIFSRTQQRLRSILGSGNSIRFHSFASHGAGKPITAQQSDSLKTLYEQYTSSQNQSSINPILRRLNFAVERTEREDAIVDLTIGMEAAVGEIGETAHKTAIRLAALIGESARDRSDVFHNVKKHVYPTRSNIAHGQSPAKAKVDQAYDLALAYVQRLTKSLLRLKHGFQRANVDELLLAGFGSYSADDTKFLGLAGSPAADRAPEEPKP